MSMSMRRTKPAVAFALALVVAGALPVAALAARADEADRLAAIWNDPTFQKDFVGSYGINAEIEPRFTPEELKLLEEIRPLMGAAETLPQAEALLLEKMKPDCSATLDFTLGNLQFQQQKLAEALATYERAVAKFPSFRRAWRNIGLIHANASEFDPAIAAFTKMIVLGGGDANSYGVLGYAYSAKQDYQAAEAAYRNALLLDPDNLQWRMGLTECVFKQQKFADACALLDSLLERHPDNADFWLLQAHAYMGLEQPLKAAQDLESMDGLGKSTVDSLHTLGDIYLNQDLADLAVNAYLRAIDVDVAQPLARPLHAAEMLAARGALEPSRRLAAHIHQTWDGQMDEDDRRTLLKLEARLSMAQGTGSAETAKVLEEIIALDPLDGDALMLLGQHCAQQNEPDRAIFYYERAGSLEAYEVTAKIRQAQVLVSLSRYADAVPLLRRAQELKPRDDVARYLEQVERIAKARR